jgi:hypothetical protein
MSNPSPLEQSRADGQRQGDAFGASLASLSEQAALGRIQSLCFVILAGKRTLCEAGRSPEQAQAWAEGYVSGFEPHTREWGKRFSGR